MKQDYAPKLNASQEDIKAEDLTLRFFENPYIKNAINKYKCQPAISSKKHFFFEKKLMSMNHSAKKKQPDVQFLKHGKSNYKISQKHSKTIIFTKFMPDNLQPNITIMHLNLSKDGLLTLGSQSGARNGKHDERIDTNYSKKEKKKSSLLKLHKSKIIFHPPLLRASLEKYESNNCSIEKPFTKKPPLPVYHKTDFPLRKEKDVFEKCRHVKTLSKDYKTNSSDYIYTFNTINCSTPKRKENSSTLLKHSLMKKIIQDSIKANRLIERFQVLK